MKTILRWCIPDSLRIMPFMYSGELLVNALLKNWPMRNLDDDDVPVFLWMPEWMNVWVYEATLLWRKMMGKNVDKL